MMWEMLAKDVLSEDQMYISEFDPGFTYRFPIGGLRNPVPVPCSGGVFAILGVYGEYLYVGRTRSLKWRKWRLPSFIGVMTGGDPHSAHTYVCRPCNGSDAEMLARITLEKYEERTGRRPPLHRAGFRPGWF